MPRKLKHKFKSGRMHLRSLRFSKELVSQNYTEDATDSNNPNVNLSSPDANWENYQLRINPTDNWMVLNSPLSHLSPPLARTNFDAQMQSRGSCVRAVIIKWRFRAHPHTNIIPNVWCIFSSSRYICRPHYRWTNPCPRVFLWLSFFRRACLRYRGRSKHWAHYPGDDSLGVTR